MKTCAPLILLLSVGGVQAFAPQSQSARTSTTAVNMGGFLDGRAPKIDVMKQEDDAMWIDDDDSSGGGWNPFAKKAKKADTPAPKKAVKKTVAAAKKAAPAPPKKAGGFKMPWDK